MPKINNLKSAVTAGKSVVGQVSGALEEVAGAAGKGAFSVSAGPNGVSISANFNELLRKKLSGNRVVSPIKELYNNPKGAAPIQYPADLDNDHYMIYKIMRRVRKNRLSTSERYVYQSIVLPVPSQLSVAQGASYNDTELGAFGAMAAGRIGADDIKSAGRALSDVIGGAIENATNAFKSGDTDAGVQAAGMAAPGLATAAASKLAGPIGGLLALGGTSGGVVAGISVDTGLALNPHMAVVFQGVGFRSHSFTYKMIARNQQESDSIKKICNYFKYAMLPAYEAGSLAFKYPDEFEIDFAETIAPYLFDIGTCVLENVTINYNGEGIPLFFETTGAPVSIELTLQFKETEIFTKDRMGVEGLFTTNASTDTEGSF